jgi:hypothetical protein
MNVIKTPPSDFLYVTLHAKQPEILRASLNKRLINKLDRWIDTAEPAENEAEQ